MSDTENDDELKRAILLSQQDNAYSPDPSTQPMEPHVVSDNGSDEELERAIALSLQKGTPPKGDSKTPIDLVSSDDEDDDLDAPVIARQNKTLAASRSGHTQITVLKAKGPPSPGKTSSTPVIESSQITSTPSQSGGSLLQGLDRKAMEEARLARNSLKRKENPTLSQSSASDFLTSNKQARNLLQSSISGGQRATTDSPQSTPASSIRTQDPGSSSSLAANDQRTSSSDQQPERFAKVISHQAQQRLGALGVQFPKGVIKKTWAHGQPRVDDIKIEEVLQKDDLKLAVLSTFQMDSDWIMSKLKDTTKVIWVLQAKGQSQKDNIQSEAPKNYKFCFPNMEGNISCMHSKLQLLAHPTHLRVVVPSANLTDYDWGERGGIMENVVFMIDLPRLPVEQVQHNQLTPFAVELLFFLEALGIEADTINSLKKFDFRQTADLAFVHSIGGAHADWKREGFCGLGTSVRALGLNSERAPKVDFVAASLGNLSDSFLKSMYLATMGHTQDAQKNHTWLDDQANGDPPSKVVISDTDVKNNCRIYFPTEQTVEASKGGKASGGTICFQRKWYENAGFPRSLMVDMKSTRKGMLSHSKMIFVRGPKPWVYVGSANLSEAAWGQLVRDKKTGEPRHIRCRNWECGVICPVPIPQTLGGGSALAEQSRQVMGMEIFHGHVPVPMMVPAEAYEGKEPWFFNSV